MDLARLESVSIPKICIDSAYLNFDKSFGVLSGSDTPIPVLHPIASYRAYDKTNDDEDRDILKDLTGNGHDIQLYNFAFAESSGYGKYNDIFSKFSVNNANCTATISHNKINITSIKTSNNSVSMIYVFCKNVTQKYSNSKFMIKVDGLKEGESIRYGKTYQETVIIDHDGIYKLNYVDYTDDQSSGLWGGFRPSQIIESCNITIEQIPDYQGALVSDGVDDYGLCENFPILTKEKGYTVCTIRKWVKFPNRNGIFLSNAIDGNNGAFQMETFLFAENPQYRTYTFGNLNPMSSYKDLFAYQTSSNYSGIKDLIVGRNTVGTNRIVLFASGYLNWNASIALYALEIYNRDLTDEEIAKVKARMIAEYEEKTGNKYEEETI